MATDAFAGPIDFLVFTFPAGAAVGAGLSAVLDRVDAGTIELLDLEIVGLNADREPVRLALADVQGDTDLSAFAGAESGILDADDLGRIAEALQPGDFAIALVYEDRSLASAAAAWSAVGGAELFSGGVDIAELERALDDETTAAPEPTEGTGR